VTDTLELEKQAEAARLLQEADAAKAKKAAHAQEQAKKAAKREKFVKEKKEMLAERKKERAATRAKQAAEAAEARVRQEQDALRELEAEAAQAQKAAEAQAKQEQDALLEQQAKAAEEKKVADAHLKKVMEALKKAGDDQAKLNADASAEEKAKEAKPADDDEEMTEAPLLTGEDGEYPAGLFSDGEDSPMSSDDEDVLGKGGKWENVFPQEDIDMGGNEPSSASPPVTGRDTEMREDEPVLKHEPPSEELEMQDPPSTAATVPLPSSYSYNSLALPGLQGTSLGQLQTTHPRPESKRCEMFRRPPQTKAIRLLLCRKRLLSLLARAMRPHHPFLWAMARRSCHPLRRRTKSLTFTRQSGAPLVPAKAVSIRTETLDLCRK
jgi:hypothetical protein